MLRIIGDLHGHQFLYRHFVENCVHTIQLGDFGLNYSILKQVTETHKVLAGNHDNYDEMWSGHWLGDFGIHEVPDFYPIFFVRGAESIDKKTRLIGRNLWEQEQLTMRQMQVALDLYKQTKPKFVLSHDCPDSVCQKAFGSKRWDNELIKPSFTSQLLQQMFDFHKPDYWIFGHHHRPWKAMFCSTIFECVAKDAYIDLEYEKETDTLKKLGSGRFEHIEGD